jgi:two-component system phosphate regulon sensor histidine kinase PhoR
VTTNLNLLVAAESVPSSSISLPSVVIACSVTAIIVLAMTMVMHYRRWASPVRQLSKMTDKLVGGEWSARAGEVGGAGDVRAFAEKLNALAATAQRQLTDLQDQRRDLQALVDTLPDPVLLIDSGRRLNLLNTAAARLLNIPRAHVVASRPVVDSVISETAILDFLNAIPTASGSQEPEPLLQRQLPVDRNGQRLTYQAVATRTTDGLLVVLRDITTLANLVQMKTDFVANASHELRTPIAAIKIAFETLRDVYQEDAGQTDRCLSIIDGHVRRLEEMLRDLLDLSKLESPELKPRHTVMRPGDLFGPLQAALSAMAREKNVSLECAAAPAEGTFATDERLMNMILKNLVENAIKFTPEGGAVTVRIIVSGAPHSHAGLQPTLTVEVKDTGIGIPPHLTSRVFERFYQVNPARSGSAGRGTGLGLAIVKHAALALSGTVSLQSVVGQGTTVTCAFPVPAVSASEGEER